MSFRLRRAPYKPIEQVVSQTRLIDIADRIVCNGAVGVSGSVEADVPPDQIQFFCSL